MKNPIKELYCDGQPLLNEENQKACMFMLKRAFALSETEKHIIFTNRRLKEEMSVLHYENAVLNNKVVDLEEKYKQMEGMLQKLIADKDEKLKVTGFKMFSSS